MFVTVLILNYFPIIRTPHFQGKKINKYLLQHEINWVSLAPLIISGVAGCTFVCTFLPLYVLYVLSKSVAALLLHVIASGFNSKRTHKPVEDTNHEQPTSSSITTILYCCLTHMQFLCWGHLVIGASACWKREQKWFICPWQLSVNTLCPMCTAEHMICYQCAAHAKPQLGIWKRFIRSLSGVDRCSLSWWSRRGLLETWTAYSSAVGSHAL